MHSEIQIFSDVGWRRANEVFIHEFLLLFIQTETRQKHFSSVSLTSWKTLLPKVLLYFYVIFVFYFVFFFKFFCIYFVFFCISFFVFRLLLSLQPPSPALLPCRRRIIWRITTKTRHHELNIEANWSHNHVTFGMFDLVLCAVVLLNPTRPLEKSWSWSE